MNIPKDFFGRDIREGDRVVYPTYRGSMAYMNVGTIHRIVEVDLGLPGKTIAKAKVTNIVRSDGTRPFRPSPITMKNFERMVIVSRAGGYPLLTIAP